MANVCKNTISVVGLQEPPEMFLKALSKSMFGLDLDDLDPKQWGAADRVDGKTWYSTLVDEYQREGSYAARFCILYPKEPFQRLGVVVPSFYVETKWKSAVEELLRASKDFPKLTFHLAWWLLQDGPYGEFVICNGKVLEEFRRHGSWYLFDWDMLFPALTLLPAHMGLTLAQHGASRVQDAIETIEGLWAILDDSRFIDSPFHEYRNGRKLSVTKKTLDDLLAHMRQAAKDLSFDGVFLEEAEAAAKAAARELGEDPAA
jgi:hypothetical protein